MLRGATVDDEPWQATGSGVSEARGPSSARDILGCSATTVAHETAILALHQWGTRLMGFFSKLTGKSAAHKQKPTAKPEKARNDYRGVEVISHGSDCCQAAKAIAGQRFLTADVPILPLRDCDAAECRCTYKRFNDRRTDARRGSDVGFDIASQFHDEEHRSGSSSGRRSND